MWSSPYIYWSYRDHNRSYSKRCLWWNCMRAVGRPMCISTWNPATLHIQPSPILSMYTSLNKGQSKTMEPDRRITTLQRSKISVHEFSWVRKMPCSMKRIWIPCCRFNETWPFLFYLYMKLHASRFGNLFGKISQIKCDHPGLGEPSSQDVKEAFSCGPCKSPYLLSTYSLRGRDE